MPSRRQVRITRTAISPRLAISNRRILPAPMRSWLHQRHDRVLLGGLASGTQNSTTVPAAPACTEVISFIVSTSPMTVSDSTLSPSPTNGGAPGPRRPVERARQRGADTDQPVRDLLSGSGNGRHRPVWMIPPWSG